MTCDTNQAAVAMVTSEIKVMTGTQSCAQCRNEEKESRKEEGWSVWMFCTRTLLFFAGRLVFNCGENMQRVLSEYNLGWVLFLSALNELMLAFSSLGVLFLNVAKGTLWWIVQLDKLNWSYLCNYKSLSTVWDFNIAFLILCQSPSDFICCHSII